MRRGPAASAVTKMLITLETRTAVPCSLKPLSSPAEQETAASEGVPVDPRAPKPFSLFRYLSSPTGFRSVIRCPKPRREQYRSDGARLKRKLGGGHGEVFPGTKKSERALRKHTRSFTFCTPSWPDAKTKIPHKTQAIHHFWSLICQFFYAYGKTVSVSFK